jgi:predicted ArsR family transcriptional regulator
MPTDPTASDPDALTAISALGEPTRRAVYDHVVAAPGWVSRDGVAAAVGIERATAAHHLDRLADDGLLEVDFQRLSGRRGPGAGRPAKVYRRAAREFAVSLPQREYVLAGRLLADAAERSRADGVDIVTALDEVAAEEGRKLAAVVRKRTRGPLARRRAARRRAVVQVLAEHGFEPAVDETGTISLRNCPFHALAERHTELICGMNHCLLAAAVAGVADAGLEARLEPEAGHCCVRLHPVA